MLRTKKSNRFGRMHFDCIQNNKNWRISHRSTKFYSFWAKKKWTYKNKFCIFFVAQMASIKHTQKINYAVHSECEWRMREFEWKRAGDRDRNQLSEMERQKEERWLVVQDNGDDDVVNTTSKWYFCCLQVWAKDFSLNVFFYCTIHILTTTFSFSLPFTFLLSCRCSHRRVRF